MENKFKCTQCGREVDIGGDMFQNTKGVRGTKRFVPLEEPLVFCCEECIKEYFDLSGLPSLPGRRP